MCTWSYNCMVSVISTHELSLTYISYVLAQRISPNLSIPFVNLLLPVSHSGLISSGPDANIVFSGTGSLRGASRDRAAVDSGSISASLETFSGEPFIGDAPLTSIGLESALAALKLVGRERKGLLIACRRRWLTARKTATMSESFIAASTSAMESTIRNFACVWKP